MSIPLLKESLPYTTTEFDAEIDEPMTSSDAGNVEWIIPQADIRPRHIDDFEDIEDIVAELETDPSWSESLANARRSLAATDIAATHLKGLANLRLSRGLSQARLAELTGTSQSHIARIESNRADPQLGTLRRIANALSISVADLVTAMAESRE